MNMIRHDHKLRYLCIGIMLCYFLDTLLGVFPDVRQHHFPIHDFAEKMLSVFRADGDEIGTAIIIMPIGTGRFYSVFVLESVV